MNFYRRALLSEIRLLTALQGWKKVQFAWSSSDCSYDWNVVSLVLSVFFQQQLICCNTEYDPYYITDLIIFISSDHLP